MLFNVRSLATSKVTLFFFPSFTILRFLLPDDKSNAPPELTTVLLSLLTVRFQPPFSDIIPLNAFSCATFTASVSSVPAATPIICRVKPSLRLPTLTAPRELFHTKLTSFDGSSSTGS